MTYEIEDTRTELATLERVALANLTRHLPEAVELRRAIHAAPALGGEEARTTELIRRYLPGQATEVAEGMFYRIGADRGPAVAIRAELDALPITENSGYNAPSQRPGIAHLCGHDVHAAALVATTRTLQELPLPSGFVAAFQPREETMPSGARDYIASRAFIGQNIQAMLGIHLQPAIAEGYFSAEAGPVNASADDFQIVVAGRPAHGAYPHLSRDPIVAAAGVIQAIQQLVSRRINPMHPAVVTIGRIQGGDSNNQVPNDVTMLGTIRSYSQQDREFLHEQLTALAQSVSVGYGCTADVVIKDGEPVLVNDDGLAQQVSTALVADGLRTAPPFKSCGADDFAFYSTFFPSLMIFAGTGEATAGSPTLHHPSFVPEDHVVGQLARMMAISYFAAARSLLTD